MAVESLALPTTISSKRDRSILQRFLVHPLAVWGLALIGILLVIAIVAPSIGDPAQIYSNGLNKDGFPHAPPWMSSYGPPENTFLGPDHKIFPLGADTVGRDVLTRVAVGTRRTLIIALFAAVTSTCLGSLIGLVGGYIGGRTDTWLTRLTETVASLPTILLAITLATVIKDQLPDFFLFKWLSTVTHRDINPDLRLFKILVSISLVTWTGIARAVRGQTLSLKRQEFIEAARAMGCSQPTIIFRHLLPNVLPTVIAMASLAVANNILLEAGLSYLSLGVDPNEPSWGRIIADGQPFLSAAPWIAVVPGVALVIAVVAFNFVGNALREVLEAKR